jgi:hypothetical protein
MTAVRKKKVIRRKDDDDGDDAYFFGLEKLPQYHVYNLATKYALCNKLGSQRAVELIALTRNTMDEIIRLCRVRAGPASALAS